MPDSPHPNDNTECFAVKVLYQLVSCHQPADVHLRARMVTYATHCRVSVFACRVWWASSVTTVPLDSGSLSVQVNTVESFLD